MKISFTTFLLSIAGCFGNSGPWTPTGRIKNQPRPGIQNLRPRSPQNTSARLDDEGWTKPQIKSDSVPDKSTVKRQRIAKAKRKAKRGY